MLYSRSKRKLLFRTLLPVAEIIGCALWCLPGQGAVAATPIVRSAREQINALTMTLAAQRIDTLVAQQGWQGSHYQLDIFIPPAVAHARSCPNTPDVAKGESSTPALNRITLNVLCPAADWAFTVTVKPQIYVPVVMAKEDIARGELVSADRLMLKKFNVSGGRTAFITDLNSLVGMTAKRNIPTARPLTQAMFALPVLVKRDQPVIMISDSGNITIQTAGTALKEGHKGEIIRVRNDSSQRVVNAIVTGDGVVKTGG